MTAEEVQKGLKGCISEDAELCPECPYYDNRSCEAVLMTDALAYIGHLEGALREFIGKWICLEDNYCDCCVHHEECYAPEAFAGNDVVDVPEEKCIEGIIAYTCREAGRKEKRR